MDQTYGGSAGVYGARIHGQKSISGSPIGFLSRDPKVAGYVAQPHFEQAIGGLYGLLAGRAACEALVALEDRCPGRMIHFHKTTFIGAKKADAAQCKAFDFAKAANQSHYFGSYLDGGIDLSDCPPECPNCSC